VPSRAQLPAQERELYSRLRRLLTRPGLLRGSLVAMHRRCGKAACACSHDDARRHRSLYLSLSRNGQRQMVYIPPAWEARVREWVGRYAEIRDLLEQLSQEYLARVRQREG
jgi:hypothetical protein